MKHSLPTLSTLAEASADAPAAFPAVSSPRHDGWTPYKMSAFIERLGESGSIVDASRFAGMSVQACYRLRRLPGAALFAAAWEAAVAASFEALTDIAMERVRTGTPRVVRYKGEIVGLDNQVSDNLLMFMMRQRDPARYATRAALGPDAPAPAAPPPGRDRLSHYEFCDLLDASELPADEPGVRAAEAALPPLPLDYVCDDTVEQIDAALQEARRLPEIERLNRLADLEHRYPQETLRPPKLRNFVKKRKPLPGRAASP